MAHHSNSLNYMIEEQNLLGYLQNLDESMKTTINNLTKIYIYTYLKDAGCMAIVRCYKEDDERRLT